MLKIPDELSFDKAAFCEPLANVVHGVERTEIQPGRLLELSESAP